VKNNLLFAAWPYMALSLLAVGICVRYLLERRQIASVEKEMSDAWGIFGGGAVWRASLLLMALAHFCGMLFPRLILWWNRSPGRLYLLEAGGMIVAIVLLLCWCALLWRHLGRSGRPVITELSDAVFVALLFIVTLSGLLAAVLYRWGSTWSAVIVDPYLASLVRAKPEAVLMVQMPFLIRLHVFSSFAVLAVLPLTRLGAFLVFAVDRALGLAGRPAASAGRALESWMRKHSPSGWLWPEED
jgi:nitrate reductase gamma subunit